MEKRKLDIKDSSICLIVAFFISQIAIIFTQLITSAILTAVKDSAYDVANFFNKPSGYLITVLAQFAVFVGVFIYYKKKTTLTNELTKDKINVKSLILFLIIGIITLFSLNYFVNYYSLILNLFDKPISTIPYSIDKWSTYIITSISLAVLPAIGEELIFRGVIYNGLKSKGKLFAVLLSSCMFALFHFSLSQLYYPLFFGIILGFAMALTNNIYVCILVHFLNNFLNISIQFFFKTSLLHINALTITALIVGVLIYIAILSFLFYKLYKKEKTEQKIAIKENQETPKQTLLIRKNKASVKNYSFKAIFQHEKFWFYFPLIVMFALYIIIAVLGA
ncbi:MAG: CPBP family intramembrane metalloprotease [Clostridia bacterium]|nr:CPBP family intramembrane metalloprotease [Clostridia bacterium]